MRLCSWPLEAFLYAPATAGHHDQLLEAGVGRAGADVVGQLGFPTGFGADAAARPAGVEPGATQASASCHPGSPVERRRSGVPDGADGRHAPLP
jgi:hypothetical protein